MRALATAYLHTAFQQMRNKVGSSSTIIVESENLGSCVELRIVVGVRNTNMYIECFINVLVWGKGIEIELIFPALMQNYTSANFRGRRPWSWTDNIWSGHSISICMRCNMACFPQVFDSFSMSKIHSIN